MLDLAKTYMNHYPMIINLSWTQIYQITITHTQIIRVYISLQGN